MLEEVKMAPGFFLRIVGLAAFTTATVTGEFTAARKIDVDIKPFLIGIEFSHRSTCQGGIMPKANWSKSVSFIAASNVKV